MSPPKSLYFNNLFFWYKAWNSPYINHFLQPDTIIPDPSNPQVWNRYGYVGNSPINLNDPTGHVEVSPCSELAGGCHVDKTVRDKDTEKENTFRQTTDANKCKNGNHLYCSYAENHPVETATTAVVGLSGVGALESLFLEGGGDAALWGLQRLVWRASSWLTGEVIPNTVAYLLTKVGLKSVLSPFLVRYLVDFSTQNPNSKSFVIGSYDAYIKTGISQGSSYFQLPDKTFSTLAEAGDEYWQAINGGFMNKMMDAGKELFIDQAEVAFLRTGSSIPGKGLLFELDTVMKRGYLK